MFRITRINLALVSGCCTGQYRENENKAGRSCYEMEVNVIMTGRNNKPKNEGPAASPVRLDQFGEKLTEDEGNKPMNPGKNSRKSC